MKQTTSSLDDPVLTTREAATLLGVSVSTAQQWIENGAIDSWKTPGGHRRVRLSAVKKLLEGRSGNPAEPKAEPSSVEVTGEFAPAPQPDYPVPADEAQRLRALAASGLIDTPPEQVFDRLTWLATEIADAPMALVSLLTSKRQWFKSRVGLDASETPREWAFCSHAIVSDQPLIVEDARNDARFRDNPLVLGEPFIPLLCGEFHWKAGMMRAWARCVCWTGVPASWTNASCAPCRNWLRSPAKRSSDAPSVLSRK